MIGLVATLAAAASGLSVQAAAPAKPLAATCSTAGEGGVGVLHRRWILKGWERKPCGGQFSFRNKLGQSYDWESPDVVLYDDFDLRHRVARSSAAYAAIWELIFNTVRSARHVVSDEPAVLGAPATYPLPRWSSPRVSRMATTTSRASGNDRLWSGAAGTDSGESSASITRPA